MVLKESPGGRSFRQLQETLRGPSFLNRQGQGLSELKIKEILDQIAMATTSPDGLSVQYKLRADLLII